MPPTDASRFEYGVQLVRRGQAQQLCRLPTDDLRVLYTHFVRFEAGEDPSTLANQLRKPELLEGLRALVHRLPFKAIDPYST